MPETSSSPVFLVDAYADPVVVRIEGRACFMNSASLKDFFSRMIAQGRIRFVIDFQKCASMDSTFLGVLAGCALELRRRQPPGSLVACRLGPRNLELIRNLGLHRLLTVDTGPQSVDAATPLAEGKSRDELENARLTLEAHEHLVDADPANRGKFQDVIAFLRSRIEQG